LDKTLGFHRTSLQPKIQVYTVQYTCKLQQTVILSREKTEVAILLAASETGKNSCAHQKKFDSHSAERTRLWLLYLFSKGLHLGKAKHTKILNEYLLQHKALSEQFLAQMKAWRCAWKVLTVDHCNVPLEVHPCISTRHY